MTDIAFLRDHSNTVDNQDADPEQHIHRSFAHPMHSRSHEHTSGMPSGLLQLLVHKSARPTSNHSHAHIVNTAAALFVPRLRTSVPRGNLARGRTSDKVSGQRRQRRRSTSCAIQNPLRADTEGIPGDLGELRPHMLQLGHHLQSNPKDLQDCRG